ncbi:2-phospho-L-lactate guanylyltransferase [Amycolatopsis regifaucium]|uniref:Phosphoenolpyruvate guanylyltransferase n=1 Tax=Amycolatopsis regifaucium TaxID=546365 RepID=A0A154MA98_9PSEU|nr:2-phospho-L-lactate guanylyltransferase [Amycolatopsis regifaucium]KZB81456.1 2-phospho-L-lactate guanylyltransferase [Amycolatopsis regifaucium]OKA04719.1 2-phospho-L-lactate guanylyltransferase [Amycolatopsis regifaucium]SFH30892.1 2-phospho-L-lactate guanylyltransferase [Amycolatopsis regifaucium]
MDVDLIVPMKRPTQGKSRLRGAVVPERHPELVLALAYDTLAAATSADGVRRVLVVAADPASVADLVELGVEIVAEPSRGGLNAALLYGEELLRRDTPSGLVGALQADLPALRTEDLTAALAEAAGGRAFVADRQGTGTTLLLAAAGLPLAPRFGEGSARAHTASGATPLTIAAESLRADVDTADDLAHVRALGVGKRTSTLLGTPCVAM